MCVFNRNFSCQIEIRRGKKLKPYVATSLNSPLFHEEKPF
jgi:hypothetical protein